MFLGTEHSCRSRGTTYTCMQRFTEVAQALPWLQLTEGLQPVYDIQMNSVTVVMERTPGFWVEIKNQEGDKGLWCTPLSKWGLFMFFAVPLFFPALSMNALMLCENRNGQKYFNFK